MSFLKELTDKGATVAWSSIAAHPNLLALGTKDSGGSGFDDYGAELELHKLDFVNEAEGNAGTLLGKVKTSARFASLAWSEMATKQAEYPYGLIAGGMGDGSVNIWDPAKLVASHPQPKISTVQRHSGPVTDLHFNPYKSSSHLLASGGADGEVFIMALDRPDTPNVFVPSPNPNTARHTAEVTKVAWNSQVSHIIATASQDGSCIVWDLKQQKPWCELRDNARAPVTGVAWNPEQGQHLVTASGDDNNPVLKLWDLRSSTSLPLATLAGHKEGVLSVAWCPYDASLLMSCAKDNRTLLWDLFSLQPVYELSHGDGATAPAETNQMFGGFGKTAQRRYQVSWSPHIPSVVATCSFDRKVQIFSMNGARTSNGRAPKWHKQPSGASFAFGGRLVSFGAGRADTASTAAGTASGTPGTNGHGGPESKRVVKVSTVKENSKFVAASRRFEQAMATKGFRGFCQEKEQEASDSHERKVWQFMQVIFEKNARNQLLAHLGFDGEAVARQAAEFVASGQSQQNGMSSRASSPPLRQDELTRERTASAAPGDDVSPNPKNSNSADDDSAELSGALDAVSLTTPSAPSNGKSLDGKDEGLFSGPAPSNSAAPSYGIQGASVYTAESMSPAADAVIKRSLLVGNFEAAVQCCISIGNMADAMLLASCGGADLWAKTQAQYFAREASRRPFLRVVNAIIKSELGALVDSSDLSQWQETLAILSTYAKQEEFPGLCEALASRLETEAGDRKSANLCYMCAVKVPKTVAMWAEELQASNARIGGGTDTKALQDFVEKVSVFTQEPNDPPGNEVAAIFAEYAGILAGEGEMEAASKYIRGPEHAGAVLMDRLFHAVPHPPGTPAPPFPFELVNVGVSPQTVVNTSDRQVTAAQGNGLSVKAKTPSFGDNRHPTEQPLPPGWTQMMEPQRGIPYYCNTATGETQWERPPPLPHQIQQHRQAQPQPQARSQQPQHHQQQQQQQIQPTFRAQSSYQRNSQHPAQQPQPQPQPHQPQQQPTSGHAFGAYPSATSRTTDVAGPGLTRAGGPSAYSDTPATHMQHPSQQSTTGGRAQQLVGAPDVSSRGSGAAFTASPVGLQGAHPSSYQNASGSHGYAGQGLNMGNGLSALNATREVGMPGNSAAAMSAPGNATSIGGLTGPSGMTHGGTRGGVQAQPQGMQPSLSSKMPARAPMPGTPQGGSSPAPAASPAHQAPSTEDCQAVVSAMNDILGALCDLQLGGNDRKMLGDVNKAVGILYEKMGQGQVDQETLAKVQQLVESLQTRDMQAASSIQKSLANSCWQNHRDWLKGLKHLNTLVGRRL